MYVVTGPILDNPNEQIGESRITVPRAFYKTLVSFKDGEVRGIAFVIPNEKSKKPIFSYVTSIDEVEKITGIDFYHDLDKFIQDKVEANRDVKKWVSIN
jgi:endonuclease G